MIINKSIVSSDQHQEQRKTKENKTKKKRTKEHVVTLMIPDLIEKGLLWNFSVFCVHFIRIGE